MASVARVMASVAGVVGAHSRGPGFTAPGFLLTPDPATGSRAVGAASGVPGSLRTAFRIRTAADSPVGVGMLQCRRTFDRHSRKVPAEARR
ncbi:hypothetical protein GCM10023224_01010 [Streptomonospora halophila]|uniref:Secreted protein n=1 Tax=Streptomonospora halophila TaxID=427369 RepID=A0ABP9G215_9ACTN